MRGSPLSFHSSSGGLPGRSSSIVGVPRRRALVSFTTVFKGEGKVAIHITFRPSVNCRNAVTDKGLNATYFFLFLQGCIFKVVARPFAQDSVAECVNALPIGVKDLGTPGVSSCVSAR